MLNNEIKEMELAWKKFLPRYSDKELLEIFPETVEILREKLKEWDEKQKRLTDLIKKELGVIKNKPDSKSHWLWEELLNLETSEEINENIRNISRLKRLIFISNGGEIKGGGVSREQIDITLSIPIESVVAINLTKKGKTSVALCPLHNEKTPSFYIYPGNTFYCFGCNRGGNIINLIRMLYGYSFVEAVKYLLNK